MSAEAYPKRPSFYAHRYCRLLTKTCAAQDIGATAFVLCVTIAHQEDAKRYKGPVTYWNDQLQPIIGVRKWDTLNAARKRAVKAGWLHYEPGGTHRVGKYWVTIPGHLADLDDAPCDESMPTLYPGNGDNHGDNSGDNHGDNSGDNHGEPSTLTRDPTPIPKKEPADADAPPSGLLELIDGWNELPAGIVKKGNGARRSPPSKAALKGWKKAQKEPEQREAFSDIPALLEAIARAKFCHGQDWFSVPWLFGTNRYGEFNVVKILNGGHDSADKSKQQPDAPTRTHARGPDYYK